MVRLQGEFAVAVTHRMAATVPGYDGDHFGSEHPCRYIHLPDRTERRSGRTAVVSLPIPEDSEEYRGGRPGGYRARWKYLRLCSTTLRSDAPGNGDSALCVASIAPDESGDDESLFVLRTSPEVSRAR